jgi:hypothetical protein
MKTVLVRMARTKPSRFPGWTMPKLQMKDAAYATVGGVWNAKGISWSNIPLLLPKSPPKPLKPPPTILKKTTTTKNSTLPQVKATKRTLSTPTSSLERNHYPRKPTGPRNLLRNSLPT